MNHTGWNLPISQFIQIKILLKMVAGWNPIFFFLSPVSHPPLSQFNQTFTKPTGCRYTKYRFSPDIDHHQGCMYISATRLCLLLASKGVVLFGIFHVADSGYAEEWWGKTKTIPRHCSWIMDVDACVFIRTLRLDKLFKDIGKNPTLRGLELGVQSLLYRVDWISKYKI